MPERGPGPAADRPSRRGRGIDDRSLRLQSGVTAALALAAVWFAATGLGTARAPRSAGWSAFQPLTGAWFVPGAAPEWQLATASVAARALDPACLLIAAIAALALWNACSPATNPLHVLFARWLAPRLSPARAVHGRGSIRFAACLALGIGVLGMLLQLAGVPWALLIAAALVFAAALLKAAFGICLGCELSLLLTRAGLRGGADGVRSRR